MAAINKLLILFFCIAAQQINSASIFPKDISPLYPNCDSIKCPDSDKCPTDSFHPPVKENLMDILIIPTEANWRLNPVQEFIKQQNCCPKKSCICKECPSVEHFFKCGQDRVLLIQKQGNGTPGNCCDQYKCGKKPICVDRSKSIKYYPTKCKICDACKERPACEALRCKEETGHCLSETMEGKKNGSEWTEQNGCKLCRCINAEIVVSFIECQRPKCDNPKRIEGQCCPVCPEELNPLPINNYTEAIEKTTMKPNEAMKTTPSASSTSDKSTSTVPTQQPQLETISTTATAQVETEISKDLHKTETTIVYTDPIPFVMETTDAIPMEESYSTKAPSGTTDAIPTEMPEKESDNISDDNSIDSPEDTISSSTTTDANPTEMLEKESENISDDNSIDSPEDTISSSTTSLPFFHSSSSTEEESVEDFRSSSTTDGPSTGSPASPIPESTSHHKDPVTMDRTSRTVDENPSIDKLSKDPENNVIMYLIIGLCCTICIILFIYGIIRLNKWLCTTKNQIEEPEMPEKPDKQKQKKMENRIYTPVPSDPNLSQNTETSSLCFFPQCEVESDKE